VWRRLCEAAYVSDNKAIFASATKSKGCILDKHMFAAANIQNGKKRPIASLLRETYHAILFRKSNGWRRRFEL